MPYVKVVNGNVQKYPYSISDLAKDFPNDSIDGWFSENMMFRYGVFPVLEVAKPTDYTKVYTEGDPKFEVTRWVQTWVEHDAPEEEIQNRLLIRWDEIRRERNQLLAKSDWTQLEDSPLSTEKKDEWMTYRQYLRDITNTNNPFSIEFPEEPDA
jgi:hypothetical protein